MQCWCGEDEGVGATFAIFSRLERESFIDNLLV